jgi:sporulation protein YlmC with PRC-barrel domain
MSRQHWADPSLLKKEVHMKKIGSFLGVIFLLSLMMHASAQRQEKADPGAAREQSHTPSTPSPGTMALSGVLLSTESILGSHVRDPQGEEVGEIEHLMINPQTGLVMYAVVSVGGFLGMGEKNLIVPWRSLEVARDGQSVVLNASKQLLKEAPEYEKGKESELTERSKSESSDTSYSGQGQSGRSGGTDTLSAQVYDPKKEQTITGKVASVKTGASMEGIPTGFQMQVQTEASEPTRVYVGPEWYMERQGVEIRDHDDVQVTGAFATIAGQPLLLAREVALGGQTLILRDKNGKPLWSDLHNGAKQSEKAGSQR